ncbi:MAG: helix-turn-helix domain-containing protein [Planctomycetaceae bacterium]|nr:helix-turn-helix domain-containing protein [Planctomycetaceae bacterium]
MEVKNMNEIQLLTFAEVQAIFRLSNTTLRRWLVLARSGESDFPLPITELGHRARWRKSDIDAWLNRPSPQAPKHTRTETPKPTNNYNEANEKALENLRRKGLKI